MADTYRVQHTPIHRSDGVAAVGDVIEATDAELRAFGGNLEPAAASASTSDTDEGSASDGDADGDSVDAADAFDAEAFVNRTPMGDVTDDLTSGDYDDRLDAIEAAESEQKDRNGVHDAIADRREA